jgi:UDP-N-acetylglucosamine:(glucosyl)LPS alpha-1,2-N-acetylglucosaminyltransferase
MEKERVAIFIPHGGVPSKRGFAPAIVANEQAQRLKSVSPILICNHENGGKIFQQVGNLPCHHIELSQAYIRIFRKITKLDPWPLHARLAKLLHRVSPNLLHVHQLEFPVNDFLECYGGEIPIVLHAHVTTQLPKAGLANAYLAVSDFVKNRLIQKGFPSERVHVVRNGVDVSAFIPLSASNKSILKAHLGVPDNAKILIFFGRKQEVKGFDIFLRVAEKVLQTCPNYWVLAIGAEPEDARKESSYSLCANLRTTLKLTKRYWDLSSMPHEALISYLQISDIALLPSRAEPQGMAMLEAMASGCLVISSNVGGISESIETGRTGFLLDELSDIDGIVKKILDLFDSEKICSTIIDSAREKVERNFSWEASTTSLESVYSRILEGISKVKV